MAIKKKDQASVPKVPVEIERLTDRCLEARYTKNVVDEILDAKRDDLIKTIEASTEVELVEGKGFKTKHGMLIYTVRKNYEVDTELIESKVTAGEISIPDLLSMVKFDRSGVEKIIPSALKPAEGTEIFTLRDGPTFKTMMEPLKEYITGIVQMVLDEVTKATEKAEATK